MYGEPVPIPSQVSLARPSRRQPASGSHAVSGGRRAPTPIQAPAHGHGRCYSTCSCKPRSCPSEVARIPKHVRHLGSSRCFLSHSGREGRVGPKMGDKFQPTRDKEVTSQKCAWGKGIRHSRGGKSPTPSPHQGTPFSSVSTHSLLQALAGVSAGRANCTFCLGQNSEHS